VALSMPRALMVSRATVELHAPVAEALAAAPWRA